MSNLGERAHWPPGPRSRDAEPLRCHGDRESRFVVADAGDAVTRRWEEPRRRVARTEAPNHGGAKLFRIIYENYRRKQGRGTWNVKAAACVGPFGGNLPPEKVI